MHKKNTLEIYECAMKFMAERLTEKLTVQEIARNCCTSISGLEKVFARFTAGGVKCCFLDMKLEYAAKLLDEGYQVGYLAKLLNFSSTAHFSLAFKKKHGAPPLKYKASCVEDDERKMLQR